MAETTEAIQQGLADLASDLEPALVGRPTEEQASWGLQWLAAHRDWRLILDNVSPARRRWASARPRIRLAISDHEQIRGRMARHDHIAARCAK